MTPGEVDALVLDEDTTLNDIGPDLVVIQNFHDDQADTSVVQQDHVPLGHGLGQVRISDGHLLRDGLGGRRQPFNGILADRRDSVFALVNVCSGHQQNRGSALETEGPRRQEILVRFRIGVVTGAIRRVWLERFPEPAHPDLGSLGVKNDWTEFLPGYRHRPNIVNDLGGAGVVGTPVGHVDSGGRHACIHHLSEGSCVGRRRTDSADNFGH